MVIHSIPGLLFGDAQSQKMASYSLAALKRECDTCRHGSFVTQTSAHMPASRIIRDRDRPSYSCSNGLHRIHTMHGRLEECFRERERSIPVTNV